MSRLLDAVPNSEGSSQHGQQPNTHAKKGNLIVGVVRLVNPVNVRQGTEQ
jgi:hypothetical protein